MPKRRSAAKPTESADPGKPSQVARPPLPSTSRTYGKVSRGTAGRPPVPKTFAHRKRG